jgi:hypothetical protein
MISLSTLAKMVNPKWDNEMVNPLYTSSYVMNPIPFFAFIMKWGHVLVVWAIVIVCNQSHNVLEVGDKQII